MDKKKYVSRINDIKASDALKQRIIEKVGEEDMRKKNENKVAKIMASVVAVAGVAVVACVIGMNNGNRKGTDSAGNGTTNISQGATTNQEPTTSQEPTTQETPTGNQYKIHEPISNQAMNDVMYMEAIQPEYVDENNFSLKIKIFNNSEVTVKINPEFWVEVPEDDFDKGLSYAEVPPAATIDYNTDAIEVPAGETKEIDITDLFKQGYSSLLESNNSAIINFYATADMGNGEATTTLNASLTVSDKLKLSVDKAYVPYDSTSVNLIFNNLKKSEYSFTADTVLQVFNTETKEKEDIAGTKTTDEFTLAKDESKTLTIDLPENHEPGLYYVTSEIKNESGKVIMKVYESFVILADGVKGIDLTTDKDTYDVGSSTINAVLTGDGSTNWSYADFTLYRVENGNVGDIVAFSDSELNINENVMNKELTTNEALTAGKYLLIAMVDDGKEITVGVGTVKPNQIALSKEIEVK